MDSKNLPPDPKVAVKLIEHDSQHKDNIIKAGSLGKFFGSNPRVPVYIAGVTILILSLTGIIYTLCSMYYKGPSFDNVIKLWGILTPLITLPLGYIFGKETRSKEE